MATRSAETLVDLVAKVSKSPETFVDFVDQVGKSPETFLKSDGTEARSRTYLRGWPKLRRQTSQIGEGTAEKWSIAARSAETFADSVDQVGKSAGTFRKSGGTEARTRTCLPGWPKSCRQTSQKGGGTAEKWCVAARCCPALR